MSPGEQVLFDRWVRERDAEAFKTLAERYAAMVYATCTRILGNAADAEEVAQECFERLAEAGRFPGPYLGAWLHRVATNQALNRIKGDGRRKARETRYAAEHPDRSSVEWNDIYGYVDEAIAELPDKLREPIVAHFLESQSHARIAASLGVSRPTVTHRIGKGLQRARKTLEKRGAIISSSALVGLFGAHLAEAAPVPSTLTAALGKLAIAGARKSAASAPLGAGGGGVMTAITSLGTTVAAKTVAIGVTVAEETGKPV